MVEITTYGLDSIRYQVRIRVPGGIAGTFDFHVKRNKKKTTKLGFLTGTMSVFPFTNVRAEFSLMSMTYY